VIAQIDVHQLQARLAAGEPLVLLDVREPWEHALGHLTGDVHVPLGELDARLDEVPRTEALVVCYCHHGVRSLHAAAFLQGEGWPQVASLAGGIDAWSVRVDPGVRRY
jgi:adenylyltransferase/sulfurtransferase